MHRLLPLLCLLAGFLLPAVPAWAEEVFILENGNVMRGRVVSENEEQIILRLSGFAEENRITIRPSEVVRRFLNVDPKRQAKLRAAAQEEEITLAFQPEAPRDGVPKTTLIAPDLMALRDRDAAGLPQGDVPMASEDFFSRLQRVSIASTPASLEGRLLLGLLLFVVMTVLVAGGARLLGMRATSLHASSSLGLLLGVFLVSDFLFSDALLRADRTLWVVPLQVVIWLGVARSTLDAPIIRTVPLFALVLFASMCFAFATGSLLVSV